VAKNASPIISQRFGKSELAGGRCEAGSMEAPLSYVAWLGATAILYKTQSI